MNIGISIMIKKPQKELPGPLSFLDPFSNHVSLRPRQQFLITSTFTVIIKYTIKKILWRSFLYERKLWYKYWAVFKKCKSKKRIRYFLNFEKNSSKKTLLVWESGILWENLPKFGSFPLFLPPPPPPPPADYPPSRSCSCCCYQCTVVILINATT